MKATNLIHTVGVTLLAILTISCQKEKQPLELGPLFADHMVLQQQDEVAFWGTATPNSEVNISGSWGTTATAKVSPNGEWTTQLATPEAGGPFTVSISAADTSIILSDVLIGEVWVASGQSNMEMPLQGFLPNETIDNYQEEVANADYPSIRFFDVERSIAYSPKSDYVGEWKVTSPETAHLFTATGYFFARKLYQELGVPVGIIGSNWGGTPAEAWTSKEKLLGIGEFEDELSALNVETIEAIESWFAQFPKIPGVSTEEEWRTLSLRDDDYKNVDFDDSAWPTTDLPAVIEELECKGPDGAVWFRKSFMLESPDSDLTFSVENGVDDSDVAYINGQMFGSTVCWNCPREYTIPASTLKQGENTIAIRIIDTGGGGGFSGKVSLKEADGSEIPIAEGWSYMQIADYQSGHFLLFHEKPEALANAPEGLSSFSFNANSPSVLFNGMIQPIIPFGIKGAIWYQGESNVGRHVQYEKMFQAMITDWRERWGSEFPFYFVQIAPFSYGSERSAALRDAQRKSLATPKTGMAVTMDIGDDVSIHPGNKQDIGDRLAKWALVQDYGKDMVYSGPLYASHSTDGNILTVSFEHTGSGLMAGKGGLQNFEVAGEDGVFHTATAKIVGDQIALTSSKVSAPVHVRYGWKDYLVGSLFNQEGLPASSFSSISDNVE
ncbi:MAG: sialate O-acetylesterase [Bacteroidota bacterium]